MKFHCPKNELRDAVVAADRITAKNPSLPVLKSVIIEARENTVTVKATNLEIGAEFTLTAAVEEEGLVAVSGTILGNYLQNLGETSELRVAQHGTTLTVAATRSTTTINLLPAEDFPIIPRVDGEVEFSITARDLTDQFRAVVYAASQSDIKPEIASVYVYADNRDLIAVATDSFRLAEKRRVNVFEADNQFSAIIPCKNATDIIRILEGLSGVLVVRADKHQVTIAGDGIYITTRIIDGVYPNYRQIIPRNTTTTATIAKSELLQALRLTSIFADRFYQVDCTLESPDRFELVSRNQEAGEAAISVPATVEGEGLTVSFNARYVLDALQSISADSLVMQLTEKNRPLVIAGVGDATFTYLVMPVNR